MPKTRAELVAGVRRWLLEQTASHYTDAAIIAGLDLVARRVWIKLDRLPRMQHLVTVQTAVDVVADQEAYSYPSNLMSWRTVQILMDSGEYLNLERLDMEDWDESVCGLDNTTATLPAWYVPLATTFLLRPTPGKAITNGVRFIGTSEYTDMTADGSYTGMPATLDAAVELGAAALLPMSRGDKIAAGIQALHEQYLAEALEAMAVREHSSRHMHSVRDD